MDGEGGVQLAPTEEELDALALSSTGSAPPVKKLTEKQLKFEESLEKQQATFLRAIDQHLYFKKVAEGAAARAEEERVAALKASARKKESPDITAMRRFLGKQPKTTLEVVKEELAEKAARTAKFKSEAQMYRRYKSVKANPSP